MDNFLKDQREHVGLTPEEMAEKTNWSLASILLVERLDSPPLWAFVRYAQLLDYTLELRAVSNQTGQLLVSEMV